MFQNLRQSSLPPNNKRPHQQPPLRSKRGRPTRPLLQCNKHVLKSNIFKAKPPRFLHRIRRCIFHNKRYQYGSLIIQKSKQIKLYKPGRGKVEEFVILERFYAIIIR